MGTMIAAWVFLWAYILPAVLALAFLATWWNPAGMRKHARVVIEFGHRLGALLFARADFLDVRREHRREAKRKERVIRAMICEDLRTAYLERR